MIMKSVPLLTVTHSVHRCSSTRTGSLMVPETDVSCHWAHIIHVKKTTLTGFPLPPPVWFSVILLPNNSRNLARVYSLGFAAKLQSVRFIFKSLRTAAPLGTVLFRKIYTDLSIQMVLCHHDVHLIYIFIHFVGKRGIQNHEPSRPRCAREAERSRPSAAWCWGRCSVRMAFNKVTRV